MPCECINIDLIIEGQIVSVEVTPNGNIVGGVEQFEAPFFETDIFIEYDIGNNRWIMYVGNDPFFAFFTSSNKSCPFGIWAVVVNEGGLTFAETTPCGATCDCIDVTIFNFAGFGTANLTTPTGTFPNGQPFWQFELNNPPPPLGDGLPSGVFAEISQINGVGDWYIWSGIIINGIPNQGRQELRLSLRKCPYGSISEWVPTEFANNFTEAETVECSGPTCVDHEDRHKREFKSIKLPKPFIEQNRGWKQDCCVCSPMLTLASLTDSETWKNDVSSAWIKLSDPTDVVSFELYKNNTLTTYTPTLVSFPNEADAYYTTIQWKDVLASDGIGCFELRVSYNISGVVGGYLWGSYNLREYSVQNALKTARIRVKFNLQQEIEGINFTNANVEDCIRFNGFIGERQPNTEIDNLIYQNREVKTVVRENLNKYTITTDPSEECLITKLTDLYLLSENEMFISDYNAHNHSYKYLDLPVIVEESPEIDYLDILQRKAKLTCVVGDRRKNKRTFY